MRETEARITGARAQLDALACTLAHGDLSPTNVLINDGAISGVVDWESAKAAPRTNDIAWWSIFAPPRMVEPLRRDYARHVELDDSFDAVLSLTRLRIFSTRVAYTRSVGDVGSFHSAVEALSNEVALR